MPPVKRHPRFSAAKAGDIVAAGTVVAELINLESVERLRALVHDQPAELLPVHALEAGGVNEIPVALARELGRRLGLPVSTSVVQSNAVGHTGADGFHRLANQALFEGAVTRGASYLLVDDFVGQGGTLANLTGFVSSQEATVLSARPSPSWSCSSGSGTVDVDTPVSIEVPNPVGACSVYVAAPVTRLQVIG